MKLASMSCGFYSLLRTGAFVTCHRIEDGVCVFVVGSSTTFDVARSVIAVCCVYKISPNAAGSGIPEMKSILSGVVVSRYLSFRTYFAKVIGIVAALSSGATIGLSVVVI